MTVMFLKDVPHPLDVDVTRIGAEPRQIQIGGRLVEFYTAPCPDECGYLIVWTDTMPLFNAVDVDHAGQWLQGTYTPPGQHGMSSEPETEAACG